MQPEISIKGLAVITGASSGIGYELARCAAQDGYDLIIISDAPARQRQDTLHRVDSRFRAGHLSGDL